VIDRTRGCVATEEFWGDVRIELPEGYDPAEYTPISKPEDPEEVKRKLKALITPDRHPAADALEAAGFGPEDNKVTVHIVNTLDLKAETQKAVSKAIREAAARIGDHMRQTVQAFGSVEAQAWASKQAMDRLILGFDQAVGRDMSFIGFWPPEWALREARLTRIREEQQLRGFAFHDIDFDSLEAPLSPTGGCRSWAGASWSPTAPGPLAGGGHPGPCRLAGRCSGSTMG
jgi:hypothetical protein